jgi:hypothetical protein
MEDKETGYIIVQDSRITPDVLMLADTALNNGMRWTIDKKKAFIFSTEEEANAVCANFKYNNPRVLPAWFPLNYLGLDKKAEEIVQPIVDQVSEIFQKENSKTSIKPQNFTNMFENITNQFNGMFGKVASGMCRLTMNGNIAVKTSDGYKSYNVERKRLTNVNNFCFNIGDEMFFVIPTNKVQVGDIILVKGKPKCVVSATKECINVIDYESSEMRQVIPERHIFMGSTYFYGKIVSCFGNMFSNGKGLKNVVKMMMLSQLGGKDSGMGGLGQMMAMSMMMGDGGNMFSDMFNFDFDDPEDPEESDLILENMDDNDPEEEEVPIKKTKKSRKE